jgi:pilus assembly protein Flp/PilA
MNRMTKGVRRFLREDDGAAIAEYGLLLAIVAVGMIGILTAFRDEIGEWWARLRTELSTQPIGDEGGEAPPPPPPGT